MRTKRIASLLACVGMGVAASGFHSYAATDGQRPSLTAPGARGNVLHLELNRDQQGRLGVGVGGGGGNLQYNGGLVEQAGSTNYAIFWEPTGSTVSPTYNSLIQRFFGDVGGSSLYGVASQYYQVVNGTRSTITNSSSLGGSWVDTAAYPAPVLTDADIQNEVTRAMSVNGWTGGVGHEFFVFTASGETSCSLPFCSETYYCAYHSNFTGGNGSDILYASQPYPSGTLVTSCSTPTSPNHDLAADSTINVISHEMMETVTDPNLDAWYDVIGQEIGDKCNFTFGKQGADGGDITMNGHRYLVQEEWSNKGLKCTLG